MRSRDVSSALGIATSTLRKWCMRLEDDGYIFDRDERARRIFKDRDVTTLRTLQCHLVDKPLDSASKYTLLDSGMYQSDTFDHIERSIDVMGKQLQHMKQFVINLKKRYQ